MKPKSKQQTYQWFLVCFSSGQFNFWFNALVFIKRGWGLFMSRSLSISISCRHRGKQKSFWAHVCLFCLGWACEFKTQTHAWWFLWGPSHSGHRCGGTCTKGSAEVFAFISCLPPKFTVLVPPLTSPHPQFISPLILPTVSTVSHLLAYLSPPDTFACLPPPPVPQLWFRRQSCSLSLPALDHVTLPLLSCSPSEVLYVRHSGAYSPAHCLPLRICRRAYFNHRRPWSVESLQPWPRVLGKLCRTAGSGVSELYFQFRVGLKKTPMLMPLWNCRTDRTHCSLNCCCSSCSHKRRNVCWCDCV